MLNQVVSEKLAQCANNNKLIQAKLQIIKEARKPVLQDIDDIPKQNYIYPPYQPEIPTQDYLKQVNKQVKKINEEVKVINQKAELFEKKYNREERKRQDAKLFKKPVIKTKQQIEQEKKEKEDKRLDDFVNRIVAKYEPYLKKPEPIKESEMKAKKIYQQKFEHYQTKKDLTNKIQRGLESKEQKEFDLVTKKDNWVKQKQQNQFELVEDYITPEEEIKLEQESKSIIMKREQEKRKKKQQMLFYQILDEKVKLDQKIFRKNFNFLVTKIFQQIDKQKTGYISKEELLSYFKDYTIFIDIFEINWQPFKEFVIKIKATRKGLLNKLELIEILLDQKLHSKIENVAERIQNQQKEDYQLPEFDQEQQADQEEVAPEPQNEQIRDPEIDYKQLEFITQINQEFQDLNYPIYHQDLENKKIDCQIEKEQKQKQKKKLDPNFIMFNNEIGQLSEQYNKGMLEFQKNEDFVINSQLYNFQQK
ncbi:unnamed protein product [Paramecium octaurelia]|uniref:EF-hand domain-containing protein n=1 Tax=Paramecium octaurelia TaxID=43137 RepID=A0A8S1XXR4_PAROT|nr:unnamed protein product [Paramecium octaurelia]